MQKELGAAEPTTSGSSIITGSDPELTNKLIQQTAVCVYANCVLKKADDKKEELDVAILKNLVSKVAEVKEKKVLTSAWIDSVKVNIYDENREKLSWEASGVSSQSSFKTGLKGNDGIFVIEFSKNLRARYVEIIPLEWSNSEFPATPALKLELIGYNESMQDNKLPPILEDKIITNSIRNVEDALGNMIGLVTKINHFEQSEKARKQEEAKKVIFNEIQVQLHLYFCLYSLEYGDVGSRKSCFGTSTCL